MAYALTPSGSPQRKIRRVVFERIDDALERLDRLDGAAADVVEAEVHEVRKRCKEVRAVAELVRPTLGERFLSFDRPVRDAAAELSSIRDAHAVLGTLNRLLAVNNRADDGSLDSVRDHQTAIAARATMSVVHDDIRLAHARELLRTARHEATSWIIDSGFASLGEGLGNTYRRGARRHTKLVRKHTDERVHEWRKAVKHLWYQLRLLQRAAPSVLDPLVGNLDNLADALGDDHDLAVLIERLDAEPQAFGGKEVVERVSELARIQQRELRTVAMRLGATIYAESSSAFVERIGRYWELAVAEGRELRVGGIETLAEARRVDGAGHPADASTSTYERERKWLVADHPALINGTALRQGYLAIDGNVSVRVRDAGRGRCSLTVKAGRGTTRTELEWQIEPAIFEQAWADTEGRRIAKTRFRLPIGDVTIGDVTVEVDVFGGGLDGLVIAEVEFTDDATMGAFVPPAWFGREVSDDVRYTNAALAVDGLDPTHFA